MLAHQQLLAKRTQGTIDVYFEGNSITRRWGATDYPQNLANWNANFFGWNAADFGWGGDRIENILWRIQNGELDGVNPKVIVILAGANNVGREPGGDDKVADITRGIKALVDLCRQKAPNATLIAIYLCVAAAVAWILRRLAARPLGDTTPPSRAPEAA